MSATFNPAALDEFARCYGFHYDRVDPLGLVDDVYIEMVRGCRGQSSSLAMIPAYLSPSAAATPGKTVVALDAGGTNLRAALVTFDAAGKAVPGAVRKAPMPGTQGPLSADAFFDQIAAAVAPLLRDNAGAVTGIGFCFSYPMEITKDADGILLAFSKEVDAPEVIGQAIGRGLREALARQGVTAPERIVLLNDTVATLLSGLQGIPAHPDLTGADRAGVPGGPMVGLILGTGFNTAYPEGSIPKIGFENREHPQIVVCETGGFAHRYVGFLDREYDATTKNPGAYALEKAAAGAYLGPLTFHILKQAIRDGVLTFSRQAEFLAWPTLQTRDLNEFMHAPLSLEGPLGGLFTRGETDALRTVVYLTSLVTERGALLSAAVTAAAARRAVDEGTAGRDPLAPVRIAVEGTTYLIYKGMRSALESYLHVMLNRRGKRGFVVAPVEQASLFGAAVAACVR